MGERGLPLTGEGSSLGLALRGGSLLSLSPPSPVWMCLPEGWREGSVDGLCVRSNSRAGDEGVPGAAYKCLYPFLTTVTLALSVVRRGHS